MPRLGAEGGGARLASTRCSGWRGPNWGIRSYALKRPSPADSNILDPTTCSLGTVGSSKDLSGKNSRIVLESAIILKTKLCEIKVCGILGKNR